jgi:hypothetical protein
MQPTYIPWLGYFDLIDRVGKFIFLNDVQLATRSWQVRNRIKTQQGELFLTIPIRRGGKSRLETKIIETEINETVWWREKHLKSIHVAYRRSGYFNEVFPFLEGLIGTPFSCLGELNMNIIMSISRRIGISTTFAKSSDFLNIEGKKDSRLVNMCQHVGCNRYISPQGSSVYIERDNPGGAFAKSNIQLFYHNYRHPVYRQLYGEFIPYMSVIDLLFNEGFRSALSIIRSGRVNPIYYLDFGKENEKQF